VHRVGRGEMGAQSAKQSKKKDQMTGIKKVGLMDSSKTWDEEGLRTNQVPKSKGKQKPTPRRPRVKPERKKKGVE